MSNESNGIPAHRSPEHMERMRQRRQETSRLGGRPRKPTVSEARELGLKELEPKAIRVLRDQLDSDDERVAQTAAVKVLEWSKGKPTATHKLHAETVRAIRYESAAWRPGPDAGAEESSTSSPPESTSYHGEESDPGLIRREPTRAGVPIPLTPRAAGC